jgi:hypothetical protein
MPSRIEFRKLPLPPASIYDVYIVYENERSIVQDKFKAALTENERDSVKALVTRMSENENYRSPKIKYNLSGYDYGEIRPMPHRFFFFQKCGNNYVFFDYYEKKTNKLPDRIYKQINEKKIRYEREFEQFFQGA